MVSFVFVTGNANKLKEVKAILAAGDSGIEVTSRALDQPSLGPIPAISLPHIPLRRIVPEIQGTTQEVALAKVRAAAEQLGTACVTEDTALCFEALGGLPGPYIKDFLDKLGLDGLNTLLQGFYTTRAIAVCTFAYSAGPGTTPILFEGTTAGNIVPPRGPTHFGWDSVMEIAVEGGGKTYAEMDGEEKNRISHRYKALEKLKTYLASKSVDAMDVRDSHWAGMGMGG